MSDKILEKNGVENSNLDGARFNRFCSGYRDGIIKGSFNECKLTKISSNVLFIDKGELLISGFRVITEPKQFTFNNLPVNSTRYQIICQITLNEDFEPEYTCLVRTNNQNIKQENILSGISGVYQIELARFTLSNEGVSEFVMIADTITGDKCSGNVFNVGNITTEKIDVGLDVEADISERIDKETGSHYLDIKFILPVNFDSVLTEFHEAKGIAQEAKAIAEGINGKATEALNKVNNLTSDPTKLDKTEATELFNGKLNKNQGSANAGRVLIIDDSGEIIPSDLKLTKTTSENGVVTYNLGFADEENEGGNTSE